MGGMLPTGPLLAKASLENESVTLMTDEAVMLCWGAPWGHALVIGLGREEAVYCTTGSRLFSLVCLS